MSTFVASPQQQQFFDWVVKGSGSCILEAVAGSGKTTTLLHGIERMRGSIFVGMFNKKIADEFKSKAPQRTDLNIGTMHSAGLRIWGRVAGRGLKIDSNKMRDLFREAYKATPVGFFESQVLDLVSYAKQGAVGVVRPADEYSVWTSMVDHFDIECTDDKGNDQSHLIIETAQILLAKSIEADKAIIDFDDMIYAPLIHKCRAYEHDWVLIDEAQDTNAARRALALLLLKRGGRLVAVGDRHQAIYGFCHPAGTPVLTPTGMIKIEDLKQDDSVIVSHTDGQVQGWQGGNRVLETHRYYHSGELLRLEADDRTVEVTPHHKLPVRVDHSDDMYYTYMMRRCGVYRVGFCKAWTSTGFMFSQRCRSEYADAGWLLGIHGSKEEAREAEAKLLMRVKGQTFSAMSDDDVSEFETDEVEAIKVLSEHGRMVDFPLWTREGYKNRIRISSTAGFITEACNVIDGAMSVAFYSDDQVRGNRAKQNFVWTPVRVSARRFSGYVYGITVQPAYARGSYKQYPLYFAGPGKILVHNTGADSNALDLIAQSVSAEQLPLTVTYRCPKAVVAHAQQWVSHITAHESAPEGVVRGAQKPLLEETQSGDVVLCRFNAPLIEAAYAFIAAGKPAKVEGRDIGRNLKSVLSRFRACSYDALLKRLEQWRDREVAKYRMKEQESRAAAVEDKARCCEILITRTMTIAPQASDPVRAVCDEIDKIFADNANGGSVVFSTIHKAKGREWDRVFWMQTGPSKWARKDWEKAQERNLCYVASTRAKKELVLV